MSWCLLNIRPKAVSFRFIKFSMQDQRDQIYYGIIMLHLHEKQRPLNLDN